MENEQLDHSLLKSSLSDDRFIGLVKKYGLLVLIINILQSVLRVSFNLFPISYILSGYSSALYATYVQIFILMVNVIGNVLVAVFLFRDMRRNGNVSWIVLGITLTFKEAGAIFFLLTNLHQNFRRPV